MFPFEVFVSLECKLSGRIQIELGYHQAHLRFPRPRTGLGRHLQGRQNRPDGCRISRRSRHRQQRRADIPPQHRLTPHRHCLDPHVLRSVPSTQSYPVFVLKRLDRSKATGPSTCPFTCCISTWTGGRSPAGPALRNINYRAVKCSLSEVRKGPPFRRALTDDQAAEPIGIVPSGGYSPAAVRHSSAPTRDSPETKV